MAVPIATITAHHRTMSCEQIQRHKPTSLFMLRRPTFLLVEKSRQKRRQGTPLVPRCFRMLARLCIRKRNSPWAVAVRCQIHLSQLRLPPHERREKQNWRCVPLNDMPVVILQCSPSKRGNDRRSILPIAPQAGEHPRRGYAPPCVGERGRFLRGRENRNSLPLKRTFGTFPAREKYIPFLMGEK